MSALNQIGHFTEVKFEAHATFLMIRLILRAFHRMPHELAGDIGRLGQRTSCHHRSA